MDVEIAKVKQRIKPKQLKPGDTIGVISPASRPPDEAVLKQGVAYLESLGYRVKLGEYVLAQRGYLAGDDRQRLDDLHAMFADPEVDAVFCSRGGYGTPRLLDEIQYDLLRQNPKIFIGYSDITALNMAFFRQAGLVNFSGPMVAVECARGIHPFTADSLWSALTGNQSQIAITNPNDQDVKILKPGSATGLLFPACLSVLHGLLGTPYMPDFTGAILVLEDIDEEPYRLDRYFASMKAAGILDRISGLVLAQFIDCEASDPDKPGLAVDEVIHDYIDALAIPVLSELAYGHDRVKLTLPVGVQAKIDSNGPIINIIEPVVEITSWQS